MLQRSQQPERLRLDRLNLIVAQVECLQVVHAAEAVVAQDGQTVVGQVQVLDVVAASEGACGRSQAAAAARKIVGHLVPVLEGAKGPWRQFDCTRCFFGRL